MLVSTINFKYGNERSLITGEQADEVLKILKMMLQELTIIIKNAK